VRAASGLSALRNIQTVMPRRWRGRCTPFLGKSLVLRIVMSWPERQDRQRLWAPVPVTDSYRSGTVLRGFPLVSDFPPNATTTTMLTVDVSQRFASIPFLGELGHLLCNSDIALAKLVEKRLIYAVFKAIFWGDNPLLADQSTADKQRSNCRRKTGDSRHR
jgi:hypothetical protein